VQVATPVLQVALLALFITPLSALAAFSPSWILGLPHGSLASARTAGPESLGFQHKPACLWPGILLILFVLIFPDFSFLNPALLALIFPDLCLVLFFPDSSIGLLIGKHGLGGAVPSFGYEYCQH
jgi:hypothetical protein